MGQVSATTVLKRCRSYTKKSPTFSEKRGRFSKFRGRFFEKRGRFYLLKFGLSNSSFWTIGLKIVSSLSRIWGSDIGWYRQTLVLQLRGANQKLPHPCKDMGVIEPQSVIRPL